MAKKFFPEISFVPPLANKSVELRLISTPRSSVTTEPPKTIHIDDLFSELFRHVDRIIQIRSSPWTIAGITKEFTNGLDKLNRYKGSPQLTMDNRRMYFVSREVLRPTTDEEKEALIKRYGKPLITNIVGDCGRNSDGTYTIRLGYLRGQRTIPKHEVLDTMGHEYGHTLGQRLDGGRDEEMKAYAFVSLFMKRALGIDPYETMQEKVVDTHEQALFRVQLLLNMGISEEAILSHLTSRPFKGVKPGDYRKKL